MEDYCCMEDNCCMEDYCCIFVEILFNEFVLERQNFFGSEEDGDKGMQRNKRIKLRNFK